MSYIDNNLLPDERIFFRTRKHRIIFFFPVVWTIFSFYAANYFHNSSILIHLEWIPWLLTLIFWSYVGFNYYFSEFGVTNKRIMMREGFFYRHSNEIRLAAISQVNIDQSLLGQILNYGTVSINAFGAFDAYSLLSQPSRFQKAVNEQLDRVVSR